MTSDRDIQEYVNKDYNPGLESPQQYVSKKPFKGVVSGKGEERQQVALKEAQKIYNEANFVELPFVPLEPSPRYEEPPQFQQPSDLVNILQGQPTLQQEPPALQEPTVEGFTRRLYNALRGLFR